MFVVNLLIPGAGWGGGVGGCPSMFVNLLKLFGADCGRFLLQALGMHQPKLVEIGPLVLNGLSTHPHPRTAIQPTNITQDKP
jgi:hypothetical protein